MNNFEKLKQILDGHMKGSKGFSFSFFCCCSDTSDKIVLTADQVAFVSGLRFVTDKLENGEKVDLNDFRGASSYAEADESSSLLSNASATPGANVSSVLERSTSSIKSIPAYNDDKSRKDEMIILFLHGIYNYILQCQDTNGFVAQLIKQVEDDFSFVKSDDYLRVNTWKNFVDFIEKGIRQNIPLLTMSAFRAGVKDTIGPENGDRQSKSETSGKSSPRTTAAVSIPHGEMGAPTDTPDGRLPRGYVVAATPASRM